MLGNYHGKKRFVTLLSYTARMDIVSLLKVYLPPIRNSSSAVHAVRSLLTSRNTLSSFIVRQCIDTTLQLISTNYSSSIRQLVSEQGKIFYLCSSRYLYRDPVGTERIMRPSCTGSVCRMFILFWPCACLVFVLLLMPTPDSPALQNIDVPDSIADAIVADVSVSA